MSGKNAGAAGALAARLRPALAHLSREMRAHGQVGNLTRSQSNVIVRLDRGGPATVNELARAEGVRAQSMSATVASLMDEGWIVRTPDPRDGRKLIVSISDHAHEALRSGRLEREDWLARQIETRLSPDEREQLDALAGFLERLAD